MTDYQNAYLAIGGEFKPIGIVTDMEITAAEDFDTGYDVDLLMETYSFTMEFETAELNAEVLDKLAPRQDYVICLAVDLTSWINRFLVRDMRRDFMRKRKIGGTGNHD